MTNHKISRTLRERIAEASDADRVDIPVIMAVVATDRQTLAAIRATRGVVVVNVLFSIQTVVATVSANGAAALANRNDVLSLNLEGTAKTQKP